MVDGISRPIKLIMSPPAVSITFTATPAVTGTYVTNQGKTGTVVASATPNTYIFSNVLPGDIITFTFALTGYITQTKTVTIAETNSPINIVMELEYTDFQISAIDPTGATNLYALVRHPDGTSSEYIKLSKPWPKAMHELTGSVVTIYTCIGGDKAGICAGTTGPGQWAQFTVSKDMVSPVVVNVTVAPPTVCRLDIWPKYPALPSGGGNSLIPMYVRNADGTYPTYATKILGDAANQYSSFLTWPVGTNLTVKFVQLVSGVVQNTKIVDFGNSMPYNSKITIGVDIFFDLPITIDSTPQGADVLYMDDPYHPRLGITPFTTTAGWGERDTLQFQKANYVTQTVSPTWSPGAQSLSVTLVPNSYSIPVTSTPAGATVTESYTNPTTGETTVKNWGVTPVNITASYGDVISLTYTLSGYVPYTLANIPITGPNCIQGVSLHLAPVPTPHMYLETAVTVTPTNPKVGDEVKIIGVLRNSGTASGTSTVYVNMGATRVATSSPQTVAAGEYKTVTLYFDVPAGSTIGSQYAVCLSLT
jgi:hypothetical protein